MIKEKQPSPIVIDLTGPDGNAFYLLGMAQRLAKQMGKDGEAITKEAMSGNYDHLVSVLDREFGEFVTFLK